MGKMLVDKRRHPEGKPQLLIGSLCRCGTWYLTHLMRALPISCSHEAHKHFKVMERFPEGHINFRNTIEISGWVTPLLQKCPVGILNKHGQPIRTAYQVRNPLKVVQSTLWSWHPRGQNRAKKLTSTYIESYKLWSGVELEEPTNEDEILHLACKIIHDTFRHGMEIAEHYYPVENLRAHIEHLLRMVDFGFSEETYEGVFARIPTDTNTRQLKKDNTMWHQQLGWSDLPADIVELAQELGYKTDA